MLFIDMVFQKTFKHSVQIVIILNRIIERNFEMACDENIYETIFCPNTFIHNRQEVKICIEIFF